MAIALMELFDENVTIADLTHKLLSPNIQSNDISIETTNNFSYFFYFFL